VVQGVGVLAGVGIEEMDMPEFAADLSQEVAAALAEVSRLRGESDEEGARAYEARLASLRRIAADNGIDLTAAPTPESCAHEPEARS
jgi:hypothetical protein